MKYAIDKYLLVNKLSFLIYWTIIWLSTNFLNTFPAATKTTTILYCFWYPCCDVQYFGDHFILHYIEIFHKFWSCSNLASVHNAFVWSPVCWQPLSVSIWCVSWQRPKLNVSCKGPLGAANSLFCQLWKSDFKLVKESAPLSWGGFRREHLALIC